MQQIVETAVEIKELIDKRYEPVDKLKWLNQTLNQQAVTIWQSLKEGGKLDFYKVVLKGIADRLLAEKVIQSPNVIISLLINYIVSRADIKVLPKHSCELFPSRHWG